MNIIEMTLAEKLVTACIDQLQLDDGFHDYWHQLGRSRDRIMNDMRHEVQYRLDQELLERIGRPTEDMGSNGISTGPQILVTEGSDRLDGGGLPKPVC